MIILDDVLSALDKTTESHIVDNLLGPKGLLKELGTTVLLITHAGRCCYGSDKPSIQADFADALAVQHLPLADQIIILRENGKIAEQGSWDDFRAKADYINRLVLEERHGHSESATDGSDSRGKSVIPAAKKMVPTMTDATRKTGDIRLYSTNKELSSSPPSHS
jgi:ATP-binding cassette subfamily C (CFTR/MRP) protein 1